MRRPRVAVMLHYDQDPVRWRDRHAAGETLDETPYGYDLAQEWCDLEWCRSHPENVFVARLRRRLSAALGYDLVHAWRNRRLLREADVVWTHTEREHLAVAALPGRRPTVIAQSVWLWDDWPRTPERRRRRLARLLRRHAVELTLSPENARIAAEAVPGRTVAFVPFGSQVAADSAQPAPDPGSPVVLAPGNDVHRDWPLLREVALALPDVGFRIATARASARALDWPANAEVGPATVAELETLYATCAAVAVPLRPNAHASGITVCIEALGASRPLVASRAGGLEAYLDGAAALAAPGDAAGFARAVADAVRGDVPASGPDVLRARGLTQLDYVLRLVHVTRAVLGAPWSPAISALAPVPAPDVD